MSTKESLAHLASREGLVEQNNDLWWHGPEWFSEPSAWPADVTTTTTTETLAEAKTTREVLKHTTHQEVGCTLPVQPLAYSVYYRVGSKICT